jgi:RNA polymerase sigma factor (sigma-70 family)
VVREEEKRRRGAPLLAHEQHRDLRRQQQQRGRRAQRVRIGEAIQALPERYRGVVALRYVTDLTFAEIGQALGIPENTAKTFFQRAKLLLREALRDRLG